MSTTTYQKHRKKQGDVPLSPYMELLLTVRAKMEKSGELDGLSDEEKLSKVVMTVEKLIEHNKNG